MTGCIGIYSTCTSTSLKLQPSACGNETSSITCINTPHLCNTAKQLPCAWSKHVLEHVQSSFVQCPLRWISSDIGPSWYQPIKETIQEDQIRNSELSCYEQRHAQERLPVLQAFSAQSWHELSCNPKLQLGHVKGIFSLQRACHGLSTCRQSHNIFQYVCLSRSKILANIIAPKKIEALKELQRSSRPK